MCGGARSSAAPARPAAPTSRPWTTRCCGAAARGVTERVAEKVFTQVIAFSEFGFPKSHAAAFGLLAYQSAWLRHYHPAEYYCALFNNQPMGFYSLDALGRDAKRNGIEIRLPDVNVSDVWCVVEGRGRGRLQVGEGGQEAGGVRVALDHPYERLRFGGLAADERLLAEYAVLGFAASGHPLELLRDVLPPGVVQSDALPRLEHGAWVEVAGLVVARQRPETAKGFVFVLLEDVAGMVNVIVRPDVYVEHRTAIRGEPLLWVRGKLAKDDGTVNVIAEEAKGLQIYRGSRIADCGLEIGRAHV